MKSYTWKIEIVFIRVVANFMLGTNLNSRTDKGRFILDNGQRSSKMASWSNGDHIKHLQIETGSCFTVAYTVDYFSRLICPGEKWMPKSWNRRKVDVARLLPDGQTLFSGGRETKVSRFVRAADSLPLVSTVSMNTSLIFKKSSRMIKSSYQNIACILNNLIWNNSPQFYWKDHHHKLTISAI